MKTKVIRLGTVCRDTATGQVGTVTHLIQEMDGTIFYLFQPNLIDPKTGHPVPIFDVVGPRLSVSEDDLIEVELAYDILGSPVTDTCTGFSGTAVALTYHISGCFHIVIQPPGVLKETNTPIKRKDFDVRLCRGPKVPHFSPSELMKSREDHPSPIDTPTTRSY